MFTHGQQRSVGDAGAPHQHAQRYAQPDGNDVALHKRAPGDEQRIEKARCGNDFHDAGERARQPS